MNDKLKILKKPGARVKPYALSNHEHLFMAQGTMPSMADIVKRRVAERERGKDGLHVRVAEMRWDEVLDRCTWYPSLPPSLSPSLPLSLPPSHSHTVSGTAEP